VPKDSTFKTQVFYSDIDGRDWFSTIDKARKPQPGDWIVVGSESSKTGLAITPYRGDKRHHGRVSFLTWWKFEHSEQECWEEQRPKAKPKPAPKPMPKPKKRVYWPRQVKAC
jgi:hypothetical protein